MAAAEITPPDGFTLDASHPPPPDGFQVDAATHQQPSNYMRMLNPSLANAQQHSGGPSLMMGLRDPLDAGAQMLNRGMQAVAPAGSGFEKWTKEEAQNIETSRKGAEADYQQSPLSQWKFDPVRAAGNMAATAPLSFAMPGAGASSLFARMASGAASGAASSALQPEADINAPDFWQNKLKQSAIGGVTGAAVPAITSAIGGMISPKATPAAQELADAGVTMTPGQRAGGLRGSLEEKMQSIPLLGEKIKAARGAAVQDFNRAAINKTLAPIGESLDEATPLGREAIDEMSTKVSGAYTKLLPQLTVKADPQFAQDMGQLVNMAQTGLPADRAAQFTRILKSKVVDSFSPSGGMTGEGWKAAESELGRTAKMYRYSADADQRQLGDALLQAQSHMRDLLARSNPTMAPQIQAANQAWAMSRRVSDAASRIGAEEGVFTPNQLLSAVRSGDVTRGKTSFARGNAFMQDFAEAGKTALGGKVPDSGTAGRNAIWEIPAALAGLSYMHPLAGIGAGVGGAGLLGAYSRPWLKAAPGIASGVRNISPLLSAGAAPAVSGLLGAP